MPIDGGPGKSGETHVSRVRKPLGNVLPSTESMGVLLKFVGVSSRKVRASGPIDVDRRATTICFNSHVRTRSNTTKHATLSVQQITQHDSQTIVIIADPLGRISAHQPDCRLACCSAAWLNACVPALLPACPHLVRPSPATDSPARCGTALPAQPGPTRPSPAPPSPVQTGCLPVRLPAGASLPGQCDAGSWGDRLDKTWRLRGVAEGGRWFNEIVLAPYVPRGRKRVPEPERCACSQPCDLRSLDLEMQRYLLARIALKNSCEAAVPCCCNLYHFAANNKKLGRDRCTLFNSAGNSLVSYFSSA